MRPCHRSQGRVSFFHETMQHMPWDGVHLSPKRPCNISNGKMSIFHPVNLATDPMGVHLLPMRPDPSFLAIIIIIIMFATWQSHRSYGLLFISLLPSIPQFPWVDVYLSALAIPQVPWVDVRFSATWPSHRSHGLMSVSLLPGHPTGLMGWFHGLMSVSLLPGHPTGLMG